MGRNESVDFNGNIVCETDAAYCVNDGDSDIWIPKSQVESMTQIGDPDKKYYEFTIPEWLAEAKGII